MKPHRPCLHPLRRALARALTRAFVLVLVLALPLQASASVLARSLGPAHMHRAAAQSAAMSLTDFRRAATPPTDLRPAHHHDGVLRHAHERDDASVIAIDDAHDGDTASFAFALDAFWPIRPGDVQSAWQALSHVMRAALGWSPKPFDSMPMKRPPRVR